MKNYLNHLIEDMHKAAENLPVKPYLEISKDEECLRGVMEYESSGNEDYDFSDDEPPE